MDITALPAHGLSKAIHLREISCRDAMQAYLDRIELLNGRHNAIVSLVDRELLMIEAGAKDAALTNGEAVGWMHGFPLAPKDLTDVAGLPTTLGSPLSRDHFAVNDSLVTQRMRGAGAIMIGKTNTPEFGLGSHTFNEVFGLTPNAYDLTKSSGGSSGGAAVALATRLLPVADGSDYGGSLRNPAAWNNVFGFRPSQGRVPTWPSNDVWSSQLGTEGPMGRTVRDVALLLDTQAGYDARLPLSLNDGQRFTGDLASSVAGVRVGWLGDLGGYLSMDPGVLGVCEVGLRRFNALGCHVDSTRPGFSPEQVWEAWRTWRGWTVAARIRPFATTDARRALIKPEALWELDQGDSLSAAAVMTSSATRSAFYQHMLALFERFDVLAIPTAQVWPFDANLRWPDTINGIHMDTYHRWMEVAIYATFAGLPCMSVPVGFSDDGLPMGMQIMGRPGADLDVLRLSHAYEVSIPEILGRRPAPSGDASGS